MITNETVPKPEQKPVSNGKIIFIVLLVVFIIGIITSNPNALSKTGCNCETTDGAGNKHRGHALDMHSCTDILDGKWLGYDAPCEP